MAFVYVFCLLFQNLLEQMQMFFYDTIYNDS